MQLPPHANGVMDLNESQIEAIKGKIQILQTAFVPDEYTPVCDTFYLVSAFNKQNVGAEINGDTLEYILSE